MDGNFNFEWIKRYSLQEFGNSGKCQIDHAENMDMV